jgi:predicted nucleic acid-binding protein
MKKRVYLDTTIPSYYFEERQNLEFETKITKQWWKEEKKNYQLCLSEETLLELNKGDYPNKEKAIKLIKGIKILPLVDDIFEIAQIYIKNLIMPRKLEGDAIHLAYTSYYKIDFLLTWNCNHLANANKKEHIRIVNTKLNLSTPEIITPLELFTEEI